MLQNNSDITYSFPFNDEKGGYCMKGGIYSDQRCPICNSKFKHFEPNGMWCSEHPQCHATRLRVKFGTLNKRFKFYDLAYRFLTGIRHETDHGRFDIRDYRRDNPLGFENLVQKFLDRKNHLKGIKKYEQRLRFAVQVWHNRNVKEIDYPDFEDLFIDLKKSGLSPKYIHDINCTIQMLFRWLSKRKEIKPDQLPEFYETKPVMQYRNILTKEQQQAVLNEIYRLTWDFNPRIYIGCLFLATYINIRPNELRNIKEKHIELDHARILIPNPKEVYPKYIYLLSEDVDILNSMPRSFPEMYFFRHIKGNGQAKPGQQFGRDYLYKQWRVASDSLGFKDVSIYPGTRHTSAVAMRNRHSPEAVKRGMGTKSNKAFERYLQVTGDELRRLYQDTRTDTALTPKIIPFKNDK